MNALRRIAAGNAKSIRDRVLCSVQRGVTDRNIQLLPPPSLEKRRAATVLNHDRGLNLADCFRQSQCSDSVVKTFATVNEDSSHISELSWMEWVDDLKDGFNGDEKISCHKNIVPGKRANEEEEEIELSFENRAFEGGFRLILGAIQKVLKALYLGVTYLSSDPIEQKFEVRCLKDYVHIWLDVSGCTPEGVKVFIMSRRCRVEAIGVAHTYDTRLPHVRTVNLPVESHFDARQGTASVKNGMLLILLPYSEDEVDFKKIGEVQIPVVKA